MPHPNIIVSYSDITVSQFGLQGFNAACVQEGTKNTRVFLNFVVIIIMFRPQEDFIFAST